jgi:hypothetical protein
LFGILLPKFKEIFPGFLANAVRKGAACIGKLITIKTLDRLACSHAPAAVGHRGSEETSVDGRVAGCACLVSYELRAASAACNRKRQYRLKKLPGQCKNQRAEYIIAAESSLGHWMSSHSMSKVTVFAA